MTLKITEDPSSQWPLNFYDIQNQILNQFKKFQSHIIPLNKGTKEDGHNSLIEALEFKVKRELQSQNLTKYQQIAYSTQHIQNAHLNGRVQFDQELVQYILQHQVLNNLQQAAQISFGATPG